MDKKIRNIILIILLFGLVIFGVSITVVYFSKSDVNVASDIYDKYDDSNLPNDTSYEDNEKLYGNWNSVYTEIYRDGKLVVTLLDTDDKNIQINSYDSINICYINDEELICEDKKYSFIRNILYVEHNDTYLSGKREIIFRDKYLILKSMLNDKNDYTMLYFVNE